MKKMNKILSVMMAAAMTVSMTACGGDKKESAAAPAETTAAAAETTKQKALHTPSYVLLFSHNTMLPSDNAPILLVQARMSRSPAHDV